VAIAFTTMIASGNSNWVHGTWHIVCGTLMTFVVWRILRGDSFCFGYDDPNHNPVIGHAVLWTAPTFGVLMLLMSLLCDAVPGFQQGQQVDWMRLTFKTLEGPKEGVFVPCAILMAVASAASWRVIELVHTYHKEQSKEDSSGNQARGASWWPPMGVSTASGFWWTWKRKNTQQARGLAPGEEIRIESWDPTFCIAYIAVFCGLISIYCRDLDYLHFIFAAACIALQTLAIIGTSNSKGPHNQSGSRSASARKVLVGAILLTVFNLAMLFMFKIETPKLHIIIVVLRAWTLALVCIWPLTWLNDAEEALKFWAARYRMQSDGGRVMDVTKTEGH